MIGRTIDHYEVLRRIGQGGMGVVYEARDTKLDRLVVLKAVKSLEDPEHERRFLREARAASALNHPNIASVYDIRTVDGQDVIIMEYVGGASLGDLLARGSLPLSRTLELAGQIAAGLTAAHAAGIVHRDLKPSNIMVTDAGIVKILDFGLAKRVAGAADSGNKAPTVKLEAGETLTRPGLIVGTAAYMSPEQAKGEAVDTRSDIFSFGIVLYEMLTGRHPFLRSTDIATLGAIVAEEPEPPTRIAPALPSEVDRAVQRCLRKDPRRRWQSAADLAVELDDLKEESDTAEPVSPGPPRPRKRRRTLAWTAGGLLAVAALVVVWTRLGRESEAPVLQPSRVTYDNGMTIWPAISPDGTLIAYGSDRGTGENVDIWVQHVGQGTPTRLTRNEAPDWQPSFSPDGSRIVFRSERDGGGLYVVNALGGGERRIVDGGRYPRFSPDGAWIVFLDMAPYAAGSLHKMYLVSAEGGEPRPFQPEFGSWPIAGSVGPIWSPDGRFLMFNGARIAEPGTNDWWIAPADGGAAVRTNVFETIPQLSLGVQFPLLWLPGHIILASGTTIGGINLYRVFIQEDSRKISGPMEPLTSGSGMKYVASASTDGQIVYSDVTWTTQVWSLGLDATTGLPAGEPRQLTRDAHQKIGLSLSRDGRKVAYSVYSMSGDRFQSEIRIRDLKSGDESIPVLSAVRAASLYPQLSGDGSLLAYRSRTDDGTAFLYQRTGDAVGREICRDCWVYGFFSDPSFVLAEVEQGLIRLNPETGAQAPLLETHGSRRLLDADLSFDDGWIVVSIGEPGEPIRFYAVPVKDAPVPREDWVLIDEDVGYKSRPRWSASGNMVYYLSDRDGFLCIWGRRLDPVRKTPAGDPFPVFHAHRNGQVMSGPRGAWTLSLSADRLVFNPAELRGDIWKLKLDLN